MTPAWAQRQEALLRDCIVSPDVFDHMVECVFRAKVATPLQAKPATLGAQRRWVSIVSLIRPLLSMSSAVSAWIRPAR
jgi:hypothetical protein